MTGLRGGRGFRGHDVVRNQLIDQRESEFIRRQLNQVAYRYALDPAEDGVGNITFPAGGGPPGSGRVYFLPLKTVSQGFKLNRMKMLCSSYTSGSFVVSAAIYRLEKNQTWVKLPQTEMGVTVNSAGVFTASCQEFTLYPNETYGVATMAIGSGTLVVQQISVTSPQRRFYLDSQSVLNEQYQLSDFSTSNGGVCGFRSIYFNASVTDLV